MQYVIILSLRQPFRKTEVIMYSGRLDVDNTGNVGAADSIGYCTVCRLLLTQKKHHKTNYRKNVVSCVVNT